MQDKTTGDLSQERMSRTHMGPFFGRNGSTF